MREIRALSAAELREAYEQVMREAFPPQELKPLWAIEKMVERGEYLPCGLFDDGLAVGYMLLWRDENYVLIDYLCVPKQLRSGGIGGELIARVISSMPDETVFIGEVEAPGGDPAENAIRCRRLAFYQRCGARTLEYETGIFGVHYKTIVWARGEIDETEIMRRHAGFYRRNIPARRYADVVQIPLRPGEAVKPFELIRE